MLTNVYDRYYDGKTYLKRCGQPAMYSYRL